MWAISNVGGDTGWCLQASGGKVEMVRHRGMPAVFCCKESCKRCGGRSCSHTRGCCAGTVLTSNTKCTETLEAPCMLTPHDVDNFDLSNFRRLIRPNVDGLSGENMMPKSSEASGSDDSMSGGNVMSKSSKASDGSDDGMSGRDVMPKSSKALGSDESTEGKVTTTRRKASGSDDDMSGGNVMPKSSKASGSDKSTEGSLTATRRKASGSGNTTLGGSTTMPKTIVASAPREAAVEASSEGKATSPKRAGGKMATPTGNLAEAAAAPVAKTLRGRASQPTPTSSGPSSPTSGPGSPNPPSLDTLGNVLSTATKRLKAAKPSVVTKGGKNGKFANLAPRETLPFEAYNTLQQASENRPETS